MWAKRDCRRFAAILWKYGEAEAPATEQRWMQAHIDRCPACREKAEAIVTTATAMAALRASAVPISTLNYQDLLCRIEVQSKQRVQRAYAGRRVLCAAALLVMLALGSVVTRRGNRHADGGADRIALRTPPAAAPEAMRRASDRRLVATLTGRSALPNHGFEDLTRRASATAPAGHPLRMAQAGYHRIKSYMTHRLAERSQQLAHRIKANTKRLYADATMESAALIAAQSARQADDPQGAPPAVQARAFVMPAVGQGEDGGAKRTYVMDGIPMTTATAQARTASAQPESRATGRAL